MIASQCCGGQRRGQINPLSVEFGGQRLTVTCRDKGGHTTCTPRRDHRSRVADHHSLFVSHQSLRRPQEASLARLPGPALPSYIKPIPLVMSDKAASCSLGKKVASCS